MCYSDDISMVAFLVNLVGSIILLERCPALGIFMAFVGCMQLFDYIFWKNPCENRVNYVTTKVAMLFNHLQPFVLVLALFFVSAPHRPPFRPLTRILVLLYATAVIPYTVLAWNNVEYTLVREKSRPGLQWDWNIQPGAKVVYAIFLCCLAAVALLEIPLFPLNVLFSFFVVLSFFVTIVLHKSVGTVGRFWCHYAAYSPLLLAAIAVVSGPVPGKKG